jgi:hypothetical protein
MGTALSSSPPKAAPSHPDWYYNLLANPVATVEVGTESF